MGNLRTWAPLPWIWRHRLPQDPFIRWAAGVGSWRERRGVYRIDTLVRIEKTHTQVPGLRCPGPRPYPHLGPLGLVPGPLPWEGAAAPRSGTDGRSRRVHGERGVPDRSLAPGLPEAVLRVHRTGRRPGTGGVPQRHRDARPGPDPRRSPSRTRPQSAVPPPPQDLAPMAPRGRRHGPPLSPAAPPGGRPSPGLGSGPAAARPRLWTLPPSASGPAPGGPDGRWVSVSVEAWKPWAARTSWTRAGGVADAGSDDRRRTTGVSQRDAPSAAGVSFAKDEF
jgi:hypothetical protein